MTEKKAGGKQQNNSSSSDSDAAGGQGEKRRMRERRERQGGEGRNRATRGGKMVCLQQMFSSELREKTALRGKQGRSSAILVKLHKGGIVLSSFFSSAPLHRSRSVSCFWPTNFTGSCLFIKPLRKPEDLNHRCAPRCMCYSPGSV